MTPANSDWTTHPNAKNTQDEVHATLAHTVLIHEPMLKNALFLGFLVTSVFLGGAGCSNEAEEPEQGEDELSILPVRASEVDDAKASNDSKRIAKLVRRLASSR